ncbi:hypothetical protein TNCV_1767241 [Trichonephila clavipes]|nr:hypothetical protein TNCV_1767241 [Trichonephila clavipes]
MYENFEAKTRLIRNSLPQSTRKVFIGINMPENRSSLDLNIFAREDCTYEYSCERIETLKKLYKLYFVVVPLSRLAPRHYLTVINWPGDYGSLVVKDMDSWSACHEFEPSTVEDPPCREGLSTLNMSRLKQPLVGAVWKLGKGGPAQMSSFSLDHVSKRRGQSPLTLVRITGVNL